MADKLGDVYYVAHIRGDNLNKEAKAAGNKAGKEMGEATQKSFDAEMGKLARDLRDRFDKEGRLAGANFSDSLERQLRGRRESLSDELAGIFSDREIFDKFVGQTDRVGEGLDRLEFKLRKAKEEGIITGQQFNSLRLTMQNWGGSLRVIERDQDAYEASLRDLRHQLAGIEANKDRVTEAFNRFGVEVDNNTKSVDNHNKSIRETSSLWSRIPHNGRQAILIIGAIAGGFEQLATLGSAAGAGVVLLGTAIVTILPAIGVLVGGIASLVATMSDEDAAMPAYVANIRALGEAFAGVGKTIETALFTNLDAALGNFLNGTLPQLTGAIEGLAGSIGTSLGGLLDKLGSPTSIQQFNTILGMSAKLFDDLVVATGNFISAIGGITVAAGPSLERFGNWLVRISDQFDKWANSPVGRGQLEQWFKDGSDILSGFMDLLITTGEMLGRLVTPESVERTLAFLESLEGAMTFIEGIGEVLGELDIFGLAGQILDVIGNALLPFLELIKPIASILNDVLTTAINNLGIALTWLAPLFAPLQVAFDLWSHVIERITEYLTPLQEEITAAGEPLNGMAERITEQLIPALDDLLDSFFELLPSPEEMARIIREEVVPAIQQFADWVVREAVPAIKKFWEWIQLNVIPAIKTLGDMISGSIATWKNWSDSILRFLQPLIVGLQTVFGWFQNVLGASSKASNINRPGLSDFPRTASGGTFYTAQVRQIAEAGAEMVVPLQRPLSQVDPSVRDVAAYARGEGSTQGAGNTTIIESGAFQVTTAVADPVLVTNMVMDRVVEDALN